MKTLLLSLSLCGLAQAAAPLLIADFEGKSYGEWTVEGKAFGPGPAPGTLPGQMKVSGFSGQGLANSFVGGDDATGKLTSPAFTLERRFLNFLIGGGGWAGQTCLNLLVDGKVVRTATGENTEPGGEETLAPESWDVSEFSGKTAVLQIVDQRQGGWGHLNVDHIVLADEKAQATRVTLEKSLTVNGSHLLVPVSNAQGKNKELVLEIRDGDTLVQSFSVTLPGDGDPFWIAAYPLEHFGLKGKTVRIVSEKKTGVAESLRAGFDRIHVGNEAEALAASDYSEPYRNQFHASTRRGWVNDPNGMVFHNGLYHLYYQYNPFGIFWGNMHWGHLQSQDLVHWEEKPIALYQKSVKDMAFSGGGFVDFNNSAGLGKDTQFISFTSTGRGECLAYSKDGGLSFTELPENPVVTHVGRDPRIIWHEPEHKWVMVVYDESRSAETDATPPAHDKMPAHRSMVFYESRDLRHWSRTGAFTDPDRDTVYECPELFELPVPGQPGETRWILLGAQNRYFIGRFDGRTFHKESGPHGSPRGAFYAAQTFSGAPDGRRIQIGWVQTDVFLSRFPAQITNQAFSLPHEMSLGKTSDGLRVFLTPVREVEKLRATVLAEGQNLSAAKANELLQACQGELSEVLIGFSSPGPKQLVINGIDAHFNGRNARVFTDRTFNEIYANEGASYEVRKRPGHAFESRETKLTLAEGTAVTSLKIFRLSAGAVTVPDAPLSPQAPPAQPARSK